jgi:hypothetical protein
MALVVPKIEVLYPEFTPKKPSLEEFQKSMRTFGYMDKESKLLYLYSDIVDELISIIQLELLELEENEELGKNITLINLLKSIGIMSADTFVKNENIKDNVMNVLNTIEFNVHFIKEIIQEGGKRSRRTQKQRHKQYQKTQRQSQSQRQHKKKITKY